MGENDRPLSDGSEQTTSLRCECEQLGEIRVQRVTTLVKQS